MALARKKRKRNKPRVDQMFGSRKRRPCAYCGVMLSRETATFDHVKPLSAGGYDRKRNGKLACLKCNQLKGSMSREQFLALPALERREG